MSGVALDLRVFHSTINTYDLTIYSTWLLTTSEACLVIVPRYTPLTHERVTPCVVPQASAWKWDEERGDNKEAELVAAQFAATLGMNPLERSNVFRILSAIRDALPELVLMPPMPEYIRRKLADVVVTDRETGSVEHKEIRGV